MRILVVALAAARLREDGGLVRSLDKDKAPEPPASLVVGSLADVRKAQPAPPAPEQNVTAAAEPLKAGYVEVVDRAELAASEALSDGSSTKMILAGCLLCALLGAAARWYFTHGLRAAQRRRCDARLLKTPTRHTLTEVVHEVAGWEATERPRTISLQQQMDLSTMDVAALVERLGDATDLGSLHKALHPWAAPPATVGALAGMHIASLAADDPYGCSAKVQELGGLEQLVAFLDGTEDRRHVAYIALALLAYNDECALELVRRKVHIKVAPQMDSADPYPRASVAIMLRYLFFYSKEAKQEYLRDHGLTGFSDLLAASAPELQLAAITNLLDLVFEAGGFDSAVFVQLRKLGPGLSLRLDELARCEDADVAENAQYLRTVLADDSLLPRTTFAEPSDIVRAPPA